MQKNKKLKIVFSVLFIVALIFSSCSNIFATNEIENTEGNIVEQNAVNDDNTVVDTSDWINEDLFLSKENPTVNKVVDGNSFIVGNVVHLKSEMAGDVFVIANELIIDETAVIYNNVFVLANKITVKGVANNLYASCSTLSIEENSYGISIYKDLRVVANHVSIHSVIRRNAYIKANTLEFAEPTGDSTTNDEANILIGQDLYYSTPNELSIPAGVIYGEIEYTATSTPNKPIGNIFLDYLFDVLRILIFVFILSLVLLWLAPNFTKKIATLTVKQFFISLGIGFITFCVSIIATVVLFLTIVGINLGILVISLFTLLMLIGNFITCFTISGMINQKQKTPSKVKHVLFTLVLSIAIFLIGLIPFIGVPIQFVIYLLGMGIIVHHIFTVHKQIKE